MFQYKQDAIGIAKICRESGIENERISMKLTTTFSLLRKASACKPRYEFLRAALSREEYGDHTPINLLTILETNGLNDALWALRATAEDCEKVARLMAADFAEAVLPIWQKYSQDKRPELAIKAARDFANGLISHQQRAAARAAEDAAGEAAREAARAAREAAWAAGDAAGDAEWAAARAAARDAAATARDAAQKKQRDIFISYLQSEE